MESSVTRGATLIRHVLVFARGADKNPEPLGVASVIAEIRGILAQTFPKHIRTQFDVPDALPNVWADPTQIQQALMNLYVNARDAMPEGGTLTTSVSTVTVDRTYARLQANARPGTYIRVEVSDTGLGIAQELLGQVFDPFFTTKPTGQGTGLGLSILASIVRDHDGFVNAYSEIGRGTTFSIYLPVHAQTESVNPDVSPPESPVTRRNAQAGTTILFVDDEVSIREIGRDVLESHGYRVVLAGNGQEAVERFTQERVDAVIMDWAMPVMNGGEAIQAIRRQNPDAFIIACSGLMDRGALDRMNLDRPIEFLRKPYTEEQLLDRLASTPLATAPRSGN
jgi:hypothetical protein